MRISLLSFVLVLCAVHAAHARDTLELSGMRSSHPVAGGFYRLEDRHGVLDIKTVLAGERSGALRFVRNRQTTPNLGYTDSVWWFKFNVKAGTGRERWLLVVAYPTLDDIRLFSPDEKGEYRCRRAGDRLPFRAREIKNQNFVFPLELVPGRETTLYLRVRTQSTLILPIRIQEATGFHEADREEQYLLGIYLGFLLVMMAFNLALFAYTKERNHLYYVIYSLCFILYQLSFKGLTFYYLWPGHPGWANTALPFFATLATLAGAIFSQKYLRMKQYLPKLNRIINMLDIMLAAAVVLTLVADYSLSIRIVSFAGALAIFFIPIGVACRSRGSRSARYYLIAWSFFLAGVFMETMRSFALMPSNFFTEYATMIGSAFQAVLLTLGLADRFNRVNRENDRLREVHKELGIARKILHSILPEKAPEIPGMRIICSYRSTEEVGGDFYDFHHTGEAKFGVLIADVSGHGLPAALISSMLKIAFSGESAAAEAPERLLRNMNRLLLGKCDERFITAGYAFVDVAARELRYASAGHPPMLVWKKKERQLLTVKPPGQLLGVLPEVTCTVAALALEPGDRILLHTDGLTECPDPNGEPFGEERVAVALQESAALSGEQLTDALYAALTAWSGGCLHFEDDVALIIMELEPLPAPE